ncbi:hypothetical protein KVR01_008842 [Diaporthe batatas]|uniref:uncharacterized protein n=1 Tax=Diaporthe batatas TaxID=748121 RepID=UPI001D058A9B|nr:uncharacterized protein KVR01_008842 [Diaporthe batatas]KAG8161855.1 hypothetical protein KVR01_008842 [Diaporthe batatas]
MSATATPTKRRVLGSLDANVQMSPRSPAPGGGASPLKNKAGSREASLSLSRRASPSPRKQQVSRDGSPRKRPLDDAAATASSLPQPAAKKLCSDDAAGVAAAAAAAAAASTTVADAPVRQQTAHDTNENEPPASQATTTADRRSLSPDASSLFDVSGINTSQDTTITEPDTDAPTIATTTAPPTAAVAPAAAPTPSLSNSLAPPQLLPPPPPQTRRITSREELKQKTEILRLRLSLANYKVKTGQIDVPLDRLQVRPVPGMTRRRTPLPSMSAHTVERSTPAQQWYRLGNERKTTAETAPAAPTSLPAQPAREGEGGTRGMSPPDKQPLPRLSSASVSIVSTPRRGQRDAEEDAEEDESLTSSALRGGAAKGLLSLSQGSVGR